MDPDLTKSALIGKPQIVLEIINASKSFKTPEGGTLNALTDVCVNVEASEFVTLLGPSGCGKTTLLRTVSGFEALDAGEILIDGRAVMQIPAHRRPVNTVFQRYALFPHLDVRRNVSYALDISRVGRKDTLRRVDEMLDLVGLSGFAARRINQLSGGQQQRVALARALIARPKLLLLDEPLSALDKNLRQKMQQELKALQAELGIAFVFVTHDQDEALTMSDRIAVLANGRIQQLGQPEELYRHPKNVFTADFLGESNLLSVEVSDRAATLADGQRLEAATNDGMAHLLIRPEALTARSPSEDALCFSGVASRSVYTGTDYRVDVKTEKFGTLAALLRADDMQPQAGQDITLWARRDAVHLIPEHEAAP